MVAKIALITYSLYGHIDKVASSVEQGLKETDVSVDRFQFGEILDETALKGLGAVAKPDYPVITPEKLAEYDGFLLGAGTRYGRLPAAVSCNLCHVFILLLFHFIRLVHSLIELAVFGLKVAFKAN